MITITKQNDGVLFEFEDSKKYLYGNGSILVPFNTLSIVADESDMITLKKAASNDAFLSARYDTDLGYRSKDDAIDDLKDLLFAETGGGGGGSGVTSGQVQSMIDESISGKADTSAVTAVDNALSAYSATTDARIAEDEEVTAAALNNLDETKQDALQYYEENTEDGYAGILITNDDGEGSTEDNHINIGGGVAEIGIYTEYDDGQGNVTANNTYVYADQTMVSLQAGVTENGDTTSTELMVDANGVAINGDAVATEPYVDDAISGKADTSAVTAAIDAATSGKVDTSAITTAITSGSTDDEIPTAKATYDAIQAGGGGSANVIELTQAQYDALSGSVDPSAIYVITDATAYDPSTKVDTSAITTSITSSSTNSEVAGAKAVYDAIQAGGGGVTVDPTLDTGSTNPVANSAITNAINAKQDALSAGTGIEISGNVISATGGGATYSAGTNISIDTANTINCTLPMRVINNTNIDGGAKNSSMSSATSSISYGKGNNFSRPLSYGAAFGQYNVISNLAECSVGYASKTNYYSSTFGSSGNTLFTVGNGGAGEQVRHNAFEVRQNGDIYFPNTDDTTYQNFNQKPMVRLQDMYGALGGLKFVQCTQAEYDALVSGGTVDSSTIYFITNVVS